MSNKNGNKIKMTKSGIETLKNEVEELRKKLPLAVARVAEARDQGDLSENSEYTYARQDLEFIQNRLAELEETLSRVEELGMGGNGTTVALGSKVTVDINGKENTYEIVNKLEADPSLKKISDESPLGKVLLGKKSGDKIVFDTPKGKALYRIVKVE